MSASPHLSPRQVMFLRAGLNEIAAPAVFVPLDVANITRLHNRGLVRKLTSHRPVRYVTTDKGRELCK